MTPDIDPEEVRRALAVNGWRNERERTAIERAAMAYLRLREQPAPDTTTPASDAQAQVYAAYWKGIDDAVKIAVEYRASDALRVAIAKGRRAPNAAPDVQAQAQDDSWLCGVKPRLTRDDLHHLRTQFRETMESQGQHDHEYHLENYQCLALNLAPALIAFASDVQAQIDAAVAREREAICDLLQDFAFSETDDVNVALALAWLRNKIRARSAKGV